MGGNIMNEDYVSLEVAKLLKEKGFDLPCQAFYDNDGARIVSPVHTVNDELEDSDIACPTLYMAQKWLRVEKDIHIMIDVCASGYYAVLWKTNGTFIKTLVDKGPNDGGVWDAYEGALQAGILESLKLI